MIIFLYNLSNQLVDFIRQVIQFKKPLLCIAQSLIFLAISAVATVLGDRGLIWGTVFLSFIIPGLLVKRQNTAEP